MIQDEFLDMAENLREMKGQTVESKHLFNVNIMNVIWRMMSGSRSVYFSFTSCWANRQSSLYGHQNSLERIKLMIPWAWGVIISQYPPQVRSVKISTFTYRFDLKDEAQKKRLQDMDKIFTDFGPNINNPVMFRAMMLPRHDVFEQRLGYDSTYYMQYCPDWDIFIHDCITIIKDKSLVWENRRVIWSVLKLGGIHIWRPQNFRICWPPSLIVRILCTVCPQIWGLFDSLT